MSQARWWRPRNTGIVLHEESDHERRALTEFTGLERVYWVQCPRCRRRYWYALRYDTGQTEVQYFGRSFRDRLRHERCPTHALGPLAGPTEEEQQSR